MHKLDLRTNPDENAELSMLIDQEFDEEERLAEPEGILFLLTDDPLHFNSK